MMSSNSISIKDKPIGSTSQDELEMDRYIRALSTFIMGSDTPITIGLQGEWGTGKTSMMYMLKENLEDQNVATAWINTWEYSMFRGVKETTPAIMKGLLENLQQATSKNAGNFWQKDEIKATAGKVGKFFFKIANHVIAQHTGFNLEENLNKNEEPTNENRAEIAEIKNDIASIINNFINDTSNKYQRVVFFVDDLDRINPVDAVEVLESLKNIFDIEHCIFVLAIDYEVVIKGLEGKFGKKTEANEREFRSFFDKIIQVPFSMPTGAYDIDKFLKSKLQNLGIKDFDTSLENYMSVVKNSVGYNPRSLKRFLNTFSLINIIRSDSEIETIEPNETTHLNSPQKGSPELMLFALLGIQISYPNIFRYLSVAPNFTKWDASFATKNSIDWPKIVEKIKEFGENEYTDEPWEKVVWGFCQQDAYMRSKVMNVLELLNQLKYLFGEQLEDYMLSAMEFAAITSVDDNQESKQAITKLGNKILFSGIDTKEVQLRQMNANDTGIQIWKEVWTHIETTLKDKKYHINYAKSATILYLSDNQNKLTKIFWMKNMGKNSAGMELGFDTGNINSFNELKQIHHKLVTEFKLPDVKSIVIHPTWIQFKPGLVNEMTTNTYSTFLHFYIFNIVNANINRL